MNTPTHFVTSDHRLQRFACEIKSRLTNHYGLLGGLSENLFTLPMGLTQGGQVSCKPDPNRTRRYSFVQWLVLYRAWHSNSPAGRGLRLSYDSFTLLHY